MIAAKMNGEKVNEYDYNGTISTGSVKLDVLGTCAAAGTQEAIDAAIAQLKAGTLHVFDTNNFTVGGVKLEEYLADVAAREERSRPLLFVIFPIIITLLADLFRLFVLDGFMGK
jgi:hypothetical protein